MLCELNGEDGGKEDDEKDEQQVGHAELIWSASICG